MSTQANPIALLLQQKAAAVASAPSNRVPHITDHQPSDAPSFQANSQPFPAYPAPGAAPIAVLTYTVPQGLVAVIKWLAIVAIGGGFVDGSGNVIWRCVVNGVPIEGLDTLTAQMGNFVNPNPVQIVLNQNDVFTITVEVPAAQPPMPPGANTGARILGWTYPLNKAMDQ